MINLGPGLIFLKIKMHKIKENSLQASSDKLECMTDISWIELQNINGAVSIEINIV